MKLKLKRDIDLYLGQPLIWLFIPLTRLLGLILKRNHLNQINGDTLFIKMAGGGSLVIAYPTLKTFKENTKHKMVLLSSKGVAPFAETLNVFDEIIIVNDKSFLKFATSITKFYLSNLKRLDTVINFEAHSRLATLISLFTMARNRIGFQRHEFKPFLSLNTHSLYFNIAQSIPKSYEGVLNLYKYTKKNLKDLHTEFIRGIEKKFPINDIYNPDYYSIGIGAVCSDLALERMMPFEYWKKFISKRTYELTNKKIRIYLYGAPADKTYYAQMIQEVFNEFDFEIHNVAGFMSLGKTIHHMKITLDEYWGIDTSLLHYSRLLGIKSHLFWGPTDPSAYLEEFDFLESTNYYKGIGCSPCVHFTRNPPCLGKNECMYLF